MKTRDQILDRIKKLMAMARDGSASEAEVFTSLKIARSLMTKHGIEEHEVWFDRPDAASHVKERAAQVKSRFAFWERLIARSVAKITDTEFVLDERGPKKKVLFCGLGSDPEIAAELFRALLPAVRSSARNRGFNDRLKTKRKAYRSYCLGFSVGLFELSEQLQEREAQTSALVVAKAEVIEQHLQQHNDLRLKPSHAPKMNRRNLAFSIGRVDGRTHDLGRGKLQTV